MYVGEGEKNVRAIFTLAKKLTPASFSSTKQMPSLVHALAAATAQAIANLSISFSGNGTV